MFSYHIVIINLCVQLSLVTVSIMTILFFIIFIGLKLFYNIILVSAIQLSESAKCVCMCSITQPHMTLLEPHGLEWVAIPPGEPPDPWVKLASLVSPASAGRFFITVQPTCEIYIYIYIYIYMVKVLVAQLCPTLRDPMDCSPSSPSVHGFLQAKILEWIVILFSKGSSWPRDQTRVSRLQAVSLPCAPPGKPINKYISPPFWAFLLPLLPSV